MKTPRTSSLQNIRPIWLLGLGILTLSATHLTYGIDAIAWIASVPFLLYLARTHGIRSRIWFSLALLIAWSLAVYKIISAPIPEAIIPLFSIPIGLLQLPAYLVWSSTKNALHRTLVFPVLAVIMDWIQYSFTPFASWGVAAYTQVDQPALSQSVALFGLAGLGFVIYWVNAVVAEVILYKRYRMAIAPTCMLVLALLWGDYRLDKGRSIAQRMMTVAAVGTDSDIGGLPLPTAEENEADIRGIFERTQQAAHLGAELVVWNEAGFMLLPDQEEAWQDSIRALAAACKTSIMAAYVVPFHSPQFHYENKYILVSADGTIHQEYLKHEPVPGEPAIRGVSKQTTTLIGDVRVGGAICYDYDFPYIAKDNDLNGADVVGLPSSDWRGIDPIHTQMAAFRAIEQGQSVVRSTRFGLSAAITPYGVMNAQMSSFNDDGKLMVAQVPSQSIQTLYSIIGDLFVWLCIGGLLGVWLLQVARRKMISVGVLGLGAKVDSAERLKSKDQWGLGSGEWAVGSRQCAVRSWKILPRMLVRVLRRGLPPYDVSSSDYAGGVIVSRTTSMCSCINELIISSSNSLIN